MGDFDALRGTEAFCVMVLVDTFFLGNAGVSGFGAGERIRKQTGNDGLEFETVRSQNSCGISSLPIHSTREDENRSKKGWSCEVQSFDLMGSPNPASEVIFNVQSNRFSKNHFFSRSSGLSRHSLQQSIFELLGSIEAEGTEGVTLGERAVLVRFDSLMQSRAKLLGTSQRLT